MGEFRIGRKHAQHSYPEPPRGGTNPPATPFARNFASGPAIETNITIPGVQVPWSAIDVAAPPVPPATSVHIPITPQSTGVIRISGALTIKNKSGVDTVVVLVNPQVGDASLPFPLGDEVSIPPNGLAVIPILAEKTGLTVGVQALVSVLVSSETADVDTISIELESSTLDVQEVLAATG